MTFCFLANFDGMVGNWMMYFLGAIFYIFATAKFFGFQIGDLELKHFK